MGEVGGGGHLIGDVGHDRRAPSAAPTDEGADMVHLSGADRQAQPRKVFDVTLPMDKVSAGYVATDERRAITTLRRP